MFFKNRPKLRGFFGILIPFLLFLAVFISGPVMTLESSESAKNLVPVLLKNSDVRSSLSNKLVEQFETGAASPITLSIRAHREEFISAIDEQLSSTATITELQKNVELIYQFITTNEPTTTIQVRPLFASLLSAMGKVDPLFNVAKIVLKDIEPMVLTRDATTPQIGKWLSLGRSLFVGLILLLGLALFFFLRYSATGKRALRAVGARVLFVGLLAIGQFLVIQALANNFAKSATDSTVKTVVPVAARALFSYYQSIGIGLVVLGAVAIFTATRLKPTTPLDELPE